MYMKFTVVVDNKRLNCSMTGKTARIYREQFKRDLLLDLTQGWAKVVLQYIELKEAVTDQRALNDGAMLQTIIQAITPEVLEQMLWAALYCGGSVRIGYTEWLDTVENYEETIMTGATAFLTMHGSIQPTEQAEGIEDIDEDDKKKA